MWLLLKYSWLLPPFGTNRPGIVNITIQYLFSIILQQQLKYNMVLIISIISINLRISDVPEDEQVYYEKQFGLAHADCCCVINSLCRKFLKKK